MVEVRQPDDSWERTMSLLPKTGKVLAKSFVVDSRHNRLAGSIMFGLAKGFLHFPVCPVLEVVCTTIISLLIAGDAIIDADMVNEKIHSRYSHSSGFRKTDEVSDWQLTDDTIAQFEMRYPGVDVEEAKQEAREYAHLVVYGKKPYKRDWVCLDAMGCRDNGWDTAGTANYIDLRYMSGLTSDAMDLAIRGNITHIFTAPNAKRKVGGRKCRLVHADEWELDPVPTVATTKDVLINYLYARNLEPFVPNESIVSVLKFQRHKSLRTRILPRPVDNAAVIAPAVALPNPVVPQQPPNGQNGPPQPPPGDQPPQPPGDDQPPRPPGDQPQPPPGDDQPRDPPADGVLPPVTTPPAQGVAQGQPPPGNGGLGLALVHQAPIPAELDLALVMQANVQQRVALPAEVKTSIPDGKIPYNPFKMARLLDRPEPEPEGPGGYMSHLRHGQDRLMDEQNAPITKGKSKFKPMAPKPRKTGESITTNSEVDLKIQDGESKSQTVPAAPVHPTTEEAKKPNPVPVVVAPLPGGPAAVLGCEKALEKTKVSTDKPEEKKKQPGKKKERKEKKEGANTKRSKDHAPKSEKKTKAGSKPKG